MEHVIKRMANAVVQQLTMLANANAPKAQTTSSFTPQRLRMGA